MPATANKETKDYIFLVVRADGPCSLNHVINDCKFQGKTKGFVKALHELRMEKKIVIIEDGDGVTVELP